MRGSRPNAFGPSQVNSTGSVRSRCLAGELDQTAPQTSSFLIYRPISTGEVHSNFAWLSSSPIPIRSNPGIRRPCGPTSRRSSNLIDFRDD